MQGDSYRRMVPQEQHTQVLCKYQNCSDKDLAIRYLMELKKSRVKINIMILENLYLLSNKLEHVLKIPIKHKVVNQGRV